MKKRENEKTFETEENRKCIHKKKSHFFYVFFALVSRKLTFEIPEWHYYPLIKDIKPFISSIVLYTVIILVNIEKRRTKKREL